MCRGTRASRQRNMQVHRGSICAPSNWRGRGIVVSTEYGAITEGSTTDTAKAVQGNRTGTRFSKAMGQYPGKQVARVRNGGGQPGVGIRMAIRETDHRPGTDPTMHIARLRGERVGLRVGWRGHMEMLRHDRARTCPKCMHPKRRTAANMRDFTEIIDDPDDIYGGKRQQKRRKHEGTRPGPRATYECAAGEMVYPGHAKADRSSTENTRLGVSTGGRAKHRTINFDGVRRQYMDNWKNRSGNADRSRRDYRRNEKRGMETGWGWGTVDKSAYNTTTAAGTKQCTVEWSRLTDCRRNESSGFSSKLGRNGHGNKARNDKEIMGAVLAKQRKKHEEKNKMENEDGMVNNAGFTDGTIQRADDRLGQNGGGASR